MSLCLRARLVLPVDGPPIENGALQVEGDRVTWCGPWSERPPGATATSTVDLGEHLLMPGLINSHCHLDYTGMAEQLPPPRAFTDWIKALVALKSSWTAAEFAHSWQKGAAMLLRTGTTTVADVEAMPELLPAAWQTTPLRVISFRELIHLKSGPGNRTLVAEAAQQLTSLATTAPGRVGLSPHAPYSTTVDLLNEAADAARRHGWRLMTHVSESEAEFEMFMYRHGPMFDWLKGQRDMSDCGLGSPIQHLERIGYLDENVIAVHVNHLWRIDAGLLGRNRVSVVHCPRSHDYFKHLKFPREELASAGVNLCLGTDSLASVRKEGPTPVELDMFAEMRGLQAAAPGLSPEVILRMATVNGARALGRTSELGWLGPGTLADAIALPFSGSSADAYAAVVHHRGPVAASLIGGQWAIAPDSENAGTAGSWRSG